jgi:transcriptional regulator with XRE-family HTH domain
MLVEDLIHNFWEYYWDKKLLVMIFPLYYSSRTNKYNQTEVVERTNGDLTGVYLWKLRTGRATNPGFHIIRAIAGFFGVDTTCFSGSDEASDAELSTQRGRNVDEIQARAYQMDERSRKAILDLMDFILSTQKSEYEKQVIRPTQIEQLTRGISSAEYR